MNRKFVTYLILIACLHQAPLIQAVRADDTRKQEYQIKAAFLFNFLKFVEWPKFKTQDSNEPIIIGIIGKDVFQHAFETLKNKKIEGKKVIVEQYKGVSELEKKLQKHPKINNIRKSHMLFICPSEKKHMKDIVESVKEHGILTVADTKNFLETGGIINLIMEEKKVRFEINIAAAKNSGITIRSQLIRLAKKVIGRETSSADIDTPCVPSFS
jgi:hypothetical protein